LTTSPSGRRRGLALAALLLGTAAAWAQDRPESILPPGFGQPAPTPAPTPTPTPGPAAPAGPAAPVQTVQPLPLDDAPAADVAPEPPPPDLEAMAEYALPRASRQSLRLVGPAGPGEGALEPDAFGRAGGPYLETLMRRLDAPLPSRWASILLRRALVARVRTPNGVNGADFAAERAWLLLRMGEAAGARAVVQSVDAGNYTPKLYQVALNAMLATSDPGGLCPLADGAIRGSNEAGWVLAGAMCQALRGRPAAARPTLRAVRRRRVGLPIDALLAEKVVGIVGGRSAVSADWSGVDRLTAWRWGLATATGAEIPADLMAAANPRVLAWHALSPAVPLFARAAAADAAAERGVLSSAAMVDLYGAVAAAEDAPAALDGATADLRAAYVDDGADARLRALRRLWGRSSVEDAAQPPYARLVLTARAALRQPVRELPDADADAIVAAMLAAGLDRTAARWAGGVRAGGDAWAMLMLADPDGQGTVGYATLASYAGAGDASRRQRMFFAGLAGLGRLSDADAERAARALDVRIGAANSWTRAIDRAAARGEQGTVALLAAIGMQTGNWAGVPPQALYHIVSALRAVGLGGEARMIAAEAVARA